MALPATPKAGGTGSSYMNSPAAPVANGKGKVVPGDSSPASTYGETATGDSVPATPNEFAGTGRFGGGGVSVLDPIVAGNPIERLWAKEAPFVKPSVQDVAEILGGSLASSPNSSEGAWVPRSSIKRVASSENINARVTPLARFDDDLGYDSESNSRSEFRKKYGAGFVKDEDTSNDPFVCEGSVSCTVKAGKALPSLPAHSVSDTGDTTTPDSKTFRPRGDRATQAISSDNAQAMLPPSSCVFIANWLDVDLQHAVENAFSQFGTVYVKIKRDSNGMPFAFAQYESMPSAERAIEEGRGLLIHGRACRTERAKVNRSLYLSASNGRTISPAEAEKILQGFGDLEKVWLCTDTERQMYRLPTGIWVTFAFFQDARDAQAKFKENPKYHLESYENSQWSMDRVPSARKGTSSPMSNNGRSCVLKITGLPGTACPEHVRGLFDRFGKACIIQIEFSSRIIQETSAIVTFRSGGIAERALGYTYSLGGHKLTLKLIPFPIDARVRHQAASYSGSPSYRRRGGRAPLLSNNRYGYQPSLLDQAMVDANAGSMPFNGAAYNMNGYYSCNGYQPTPYAPYAQHDPNGTGSSTYPGSSSISGVPSMVPTWQYPFYPMYPQAPYPAPLPQAAGTSVPANETQ